MKREHLRIASLSLISLLALSSLSLEAKADVGGDAVVCFNKVETAKAVRQRVRSNEDGKSKVDPLAGVPASEITSVELLDLYEGKGSLFGDTFINSNKSYQDILKDRLQLIRQKNMLFLSLVAKYQILRNNAVSSPGGVQEIDDSNETINVPGTCSLVQLGIQKKKEHSYEPDIPFNFTYNDRLFKMLDEVNKAAFLMHEMIFASLEDINGYEELDSNVVRKLTRQVFNQDFRDLSKEDFKSFLVSLLNRPDSFLVTEEIELQGVKAFGSRTKTESWGHAYTLFEPIIYVHRGVELFVKEGAFATDLDHRVMIYGSLEKPAVINGYKVKDGISFYSNGNLRQITLAQEATINGLALSKDSKPSFNLKGELEGEAILAKEIRLGSLTLERGTEVYIFEGKIYHASNSGRMFYSGIPISSARLENGRVTEIRIDGVRLINGLKCEGIVKFHSNGQVKTCDLSGTHAWKSLVLVGPVQFHENGMLASGKLDRSNAQKLEGKNYTFSYQLYRGMKVVTETEIELYPSGKIKSAYLSEDFQISGVTCAGQTKRSFFKGYEPQSYDRVILIPEGRLQSCVRK